MTGKLNMLAALAQSEDVEADIERLEPLAPEAFEPGEVLPHCFHANGYGADYHGFKASETWKKGEDVHKHTVKVSDEYHVYGMLWEKDGYTCYIDGKQDGPKVGVATGDPVSHVPEFILLTTEAKW